MQITSLDKNHMGLSTTSSYNAAESAALPATSGALLSTKNCENAKD